MRILEQAGYLELTEELDNPSRVYFLSKRDELYQLRLGDSLSDELLQVLLRSYTGLFADFTPIQEEVLAKRIKSTARDVYDRLLYMARQGIIHYIPRKKSPYILYQTKREAKERLMLGREVYEDRRDRYQARTEAMLGYATDDQVCRSRQLLLYFGEKNAPACGHCDVCLQKHESGLGRAEFARIADTLLSLLNNGEVTFEGLIAKSGLPSEKVLNVLRYLIGEGRLLLSEERVSLPATGRP